MSVEAEWHFRSELPLGVVSPQADGAGRVQRRREAAPRVDCARNGAVAESEDLRNQMLDLDHHARRFTTNDQLQAKLVIAEDKAESAEGSVNVLDSKCKALRERVGAAESKIGELHRAQKYLNGLPKHADVGDDCTAELAVRITELESQLEQVSTGRAVSMTLQIKSKNVAESIANLHYRMEGMGRFISDSDFCPDEVFEVIHDWLADQFETVATPGATP